jgi:hypothetical protein
VENECQDSVEESAPFKMKEETARRVSAGDVGALATQGSFTRTSWKKDAGSKPGPTGDEYP